MSITSPSTVFDISTWDNITVADDFTDLSVHIVDCDGTLPITLVSYEYDCIQNSLSWITASESNNDYFRIKVGSTFKDGRLVVEDEFIIDGKGNSSSTSLYSFDLIADSKYIQATQVDYDGTSSYVFQTYINCEAEISPVILSPNPATENKGTEIIGNYKTIRIYDITAKEIKATIRDNRIINLSNGLYIVIINGKQKVKLIIN